MEPKDVEEETLAGEDGGDLDPETREPSSEPLEGGADEDVHAAAIEDEAADLEPPPEEEPAEADDAGDEVEPPPPSRPQRVGAGFLALLLALTLAVAFLAYAVTSRLVPSPLDPVWVGPGACLILAAALSGLFARQARVLRRARDGEVSTALERLASGAGTPISEEDPLAPRFLEASGRIASDARTRVVAAEEHAKKDSLRETVRVRSQCERLVERYAERLHNEKKEALQALAGLREEHDAEKKTWEASQAAIEKLRKDSADRCASTEARAAGLDRDLAARSAECARLSQEVDRLLQEVDRLRQQNVRFFDKVAAQLRGSLQIAGKLAADLAGAPPEKAGTRGKVIPSAPSLEDRAGEIRTRIARLERLVEQILDLSRIETSSLSLVYSEADVGVTLKRSCEEMRDVAVAKSIDLSFKHPKGIPGVLTDSRLLNRIVRELVSNAVRYTPRGGRVTATANVSSECPLDRPARGLEDDWLRVDVTDTGEGIRAEDAERIFTAFERGTEPQFTMSDANPGLGLTLARHYARILGGDILLQSEPGRGSVFSLVLPVKVCVTTHVS